MKHLGLSVFMVAALLSAGCKQRAFNSGDVSSAKSASSTDERDLRTVGSQFDAIKLLNKMSIQETVGTKYSEWIASLKQKYGGRYSDPDWKNTAAVPVCRQWEGGPTGGGKSEMVHTTKFLAVLRAGGSVSHGSYRSDNFSGMVHFSAVTKFEDGKQTQADDDHAIPEFKEYGFKPLLTTLFGFESTDYGAEVRGEEIVAADADPIAAVKSFFRKQAQSGAAAAAFKAEMDKAAAEYGGRFGAPNFDRDTQVLEVSGHSYGRIPETDTTRTFLVMVPYTSSYHGGHFMCDNFVMVVDYERATTTDENKPTYKVKNYGWKQVPDFGKLL